MYEGFDYGWPVASDANWRPELGGGGVLTDTGGHTLDQLVWWLGELEVLEYLDDAMGGMETDCRIQLRTAGGATGTVELSRTRNLSNTITLETEAGTLKVSLIGNDVEAEPESLLKLDVPEVGQPAFRTQQHASLFEAQLGNFRDAIQGRAEMLVSFGLAAESVRLTERCYQMRQYWDLPWVKTEPPPAATS